MSGGGHLIVNVSNYHMNCLPQLRAAANRIVLIVYPGCWCAHKKKNTWRHKRFCKQVSSDDQVISVELEEKRKKKSINAQGIPQTQQKANRLAGTHLPV